MSTSDSSRQFVKPHIREPIDKRGQLTQPRYAARGFLPAADPLRAFPRGSPYAWLDEIGRDLPSLLHDPHFRLFARELVIPSWTGAASQARLPELRLYYLRVGFMASAYINQVGAEPVQRLPANLALPLVDVCKLLRRPPILSYDGYALYNWKRFNGEAPIALGNIDTLQNFVHLYDEHWFILIHVEIEAIAARILESIAAIRAKLMRDDADILTELWSIDTAVRRQVEVLRRIPEKMDPRLYFKTFRPYIRFFEDVIYEGVDRGPIQFRGETGAQSSIMPTLIALLKIPHRRSALTDHLADMRNYMPREHRRLIEEVAAMPGIRSERNRLPFNAILDAIAEFRRSSMKPWPTRSFNNLLPAAVDRIE